MNHSRLFDIDPWKLVTKQLHKGNRRFEESLTSLGNGYMGMRGNFEEQYSGDHHQGTYLAGVWYPDKTRVGWWKNGYPKYFGKVINAMNITGISFYMDGEEVDLYKDDISDFRLELDMRQGILRHSYLVTKKNKKVRIAIERFLSIVNKEICAIRFRVTSLSDQVTIRLVSALDGNVRNEDANYDQMFWLEVDKADVKGRSSLVTRTIDNPFGIPVFVLSASMGVQIQTGTAVNVSSVLKPLYASRTYEFHLSSGQTAAIDKLVAVTTSRDYEPPQLMRKSMELLDQAMDSGYEDLKQEHIHAWDQRWKKADLVIEGDEEAQQGIRFNLFQLFSTYYGEDSRLNIGPKGFTGEKYGGATYWDTEAYAVPMYLGVASPEVTKQLLLYRYNQLDGAYYNARQQGLKGALYPMVTFTGIECHNEWEITFEEIHRNAAIAYAIYYYVNYTGDKSYINQYGIDVLVGISRFWADRVHFSERKQKYMIHGVTGPNEYENNVNNNWYTNTMAAWTLNYTIQALKEVSDAKFEKLGLSQQEIDHWRKIRDHMYFPYDEKLDIFVQHDTFLDKEIKPASEIPDEERPLNQHWSWDKILRSCYIKQADVLQGFYFLSDQFTFEEKKRNFEFYEPLTVHESSLSPSVHSIIAAELGKKDKALELYKRTARLDLDNYNKDTEDGLHITSMTGSWLAIVQGFAGMRTFNETLSFSPFLPNGWKAYTFKVNYRGRLIEIQVTGDDVSLDLLTGSPLQLKLFSQTITLKKHYQEKLPGDSNRSEEVEKLKAVIFDLDGVITDTAKYHFKAWKNLAESIDIQIDQSFNEKLKGISRMDSLQCILRFGGREKDFSEKDKEKLAEKKNEDYRKLISAITPDELLPGIHSFLDELKRAGIKTGLASASKNGSFILEKLKIAPLFDAVVDPAQLKNGKPDPEIFLTAARMLAVKPSECAGIEDAIAGIESIHRAGMFSVGVGVPGCAKADWSIKSTDELTLKSLMERFTDRIVNETK
ncbi:beta-phosphoglucomutase [Sporolactobacillus sp. THM7-4]|nr:beta-phosphoglucomutase [Sporolactobacillus sp. THM7-4]